MAQIQFDKRQVTCKIVYYGPGLSGKTTNLEVVHNKAPKDNRGDMVSIATRGDRTLYFDYMPLEVGQVAGMKTTFQLYTVPGQIYYNNTRKLVLQGVDGLVFVADSNPAKMAENVESLANLRENLASMDLALEAVPLVMQYNKRDLPNAVPVAELQKNLNQLGVPATEAIAMEGKGVFATLKEIGRLVIDKITQEQQAPAGLRRRSTGGGSQSKVAKPVGGQAAPAQQAQQARPAAQQQTRPAAQQQTRPAARQQTQPAQQRQQAARPAGQQGRPAAQQATRPQQAAPAPAQGRAAASRQATRPATAETEDDGGGVRSMAARPPRRGTGDGGGARGRRRGGAGRGRAEPQDEEPQKKGFSIIRTLVGLILFAILAVIVIPVLMLFVRPVNDFFRPLLPPKIAAFFEPAEAEAGSGVDAGSDEDSDDVEGNGDPGTEEETGDTANDGEDTTGTPEGG